MQFTDIKNRIEETLIIRKPEIELWFPDDITTCSEENLGRLLNLYTLYKNYASQQLSFSEAELHIIRETLRIKEASALISLISDKDRSSELKAKEDRQAYVTQLPEVSEAINKVALLTAAVKMEKSVLDVFEDRYSCVSRELSRRQAMWNR